MFSRVVRSGTGVSVTLSSPVSSSCVVGGALDTLMRQTMDVAGGKDSVGVTLLHTSALGMGETEADLNALKRKLLYRSKQRGMLEHDIVFSAFAADHLDTFDADGITAYGELLDVENPDMWAYLLGEEEPPEDIKSNRVWPMLLDFFEEAKADGRLSLRHNQANIGK